MSANVAETPSGSRVLSASRLAAVGGVSVIMPTLDEAGNIASLIQTTVNSLRDAGVSPLEVIVVDDDSADRTWEVAQGVSCPGADIRVERRMQNHGLTPSLRRGIELARYKVVVWLDCDFSHPPEKIPQMVYMISEGYDVVVNSRYAVGGGEDRAGKGGPMQLALSTILNWSVRFLLKPSFSDYTSGFIAAKRQVLKDIPLRGDYGEYFIDFIFRALRKHVRVCELPYEAPPRRSGESKTGKNLIDYAKRGRKYLATVARLSIESALRKI